MKKSIDFKSPSGQLYHFEIDTNGHINCLLGADVEIHKDDFTCKGVVTYIIGDEVTIKIQK